MPRSSLGTFGAALLAGAALVAESQQPAAPPSAPVATLAASATTTHPVSKSRGLIVYPAQKQSASQQSVDEQECYNWTKAQTRIDPQAPADNDADEGAKVGAAAGAVAGGRKARQEKQAHAEQANTESQAAQSERDATFRNAVSTCLHGRGYTTG